MSFALFCILPGLLCIVIGRNALKKYIEDDNEVDDALVFFGLAFSLMPVVNAVLAFCLIIIILINRLEEYEKKFNKKWYEVILFIKPKNKDYE